MKKILITGADSYIGTAFEKYVSAFPSDYSVDTVDMIDGSWRERSFSGYDVVFHVAGIAHSDISKVGDEVKELYKKVNTELAIETAEKAKADGVSQFIFMSSMIVYGDSAPIGKEKVITKDTVPTPANFYGNSKLNAEKGIEPLRDESFKVVILRPPMIYGKDSKGNYPVLAKYAQKLPFFPYVKNKRSMLYVGNLCEFIRLMIDNAESGIFFPANKEDSVTSLLVKTVSEAHNKKLLLVKGFGWLFRLAAPLVPKINKIFGNLSYDEKLTEYSTEYRLFSLEESIRETEKQ